jgi:four helix bundle protein
MYKFQQLEVYKKSIEYIKEIYTLSRKLPIDERYNLCSQIQRAATSIALNIAEGSTGQSNLEQNRFLGLSLRSYLETVACLDLIDQFEYLSHGETEKVRQLGHEIFMKLSAFRKALK